MQPKTLPFVPMKVWNTINAVSHIPDWRDQAAGFEML